MSEFIAQFLVECRELVESATGDLLALEAAPDARDRLDSAFRAFHTLKGAAGIVDFAAMGRLLHDVEETLSAVRAGDRAITPDLVGDCLAVLAQIIRWLDAMESGGVVPEGGGADSAEAEADALIARFLATPASPSVALPAAASAGPPAWAADLLAHAAPGDAPPQIALRYAPDADCFFRGDDPLALMARLPGLSALRIASREPWPDLATLDPFACNLMLTALATCPAAEAAALFRHLADQVEIHPLGPQPGSSGLSTVARTILDEQARLMEVGRGSDFAGCLGAAAACAANVLRRERRDADAVAIRAAAERAAAENSGMAFVSAVRALLAPSPPSEPTHETEPAPERPAMSEPAARALRVNVEKIDALVKLTGELTVVKNTIGHAARLAADGGDVRSLADGLKDQHALLDRLVAELQDAVLGIRVLPLRHVFQRFPRLIREIAASTGKTARLVTEGDETEADKAVVEALFEPLLHVLRNAVDHGVESSEERRNLGKPPVAAIALRGFREGERVIVEVTDDGGGINPARVREIAARRGMATAETLAAMPDEAVLQLILAAGFSTAPAVTELSGRGVGMDAARSAIERLGGEVRVASRQGEGTTIRFILPFTVMMNRVIVVEAGGQVFGIPFETVIETVRIPRAAIVAIGAARAVVLRDRTIPLLSLADTLGLPCPPRAPIEETCVLVASAAGQIGGFEVDRFGSPLHVMLTPMAGLLAGTPGVLGTTLLGDGRVLIVLDPQELLG